MRCLVCNKELTTGDLGSMCFECTNNMRTEYNYIETLSFKISRYVHDNCKDVPHDIGLKLIEIIKEHIN